MPLRIKTFNLQKNYTRCEKNIENKIVHLKKTHKFTSNYFFIGHIVFVLIVKNIIKNEKLHFTPNLCRI